MPYVTPNWIYVGVPKTGSSFMNIVLIDLFGEEGFTAAFETYDTAPEEYHNLPVISTMRNPWAWYVSYYEWFSAEERRHNRRGIMGDIEFEDWIQQNPDLMSQEIQLTAPPNAHFVRIEYIADDLIKVLNQLEEEPLTTRERLKIRNTPVINKNPRIEKHYSSYYTRPESENVILHGAADLLIKHYPSMKSIEWPDRPKEVVKPVGFNTEDRDNMKDTIIVEQGNNNLTIAFAGLPLGLSEVRHDFYKFTSGDGCSKIFCKDVQLLWYQKGVDSEINSVEALRQALQKIMGRINPTNITCIGISAGAYAALLFGHLLGADRVHAFGPQTFLSRELRAQYNIGPEWWGPEMEKVYQEAPAPTYYDLRPFLLRNTKTRSLIHVGTRCEVDQKYASHLRDIPGVEILEYDTDEHAPAAYLKREGRLTEVLEMRG